MSYVRYRVDELKSSGIYSAEQVEPETINRILNMHEVDYYDIDIVMLESYLGLLAQQIYFLQQECNIAEAHEIELGNDFKIHALPLVLGEKIRSVEERYIYAASLSAEMSQKFGAWQRAIIDATLKKKLSEPLTEKLNTLKKLYDERRLEGRNKNLQKYE